MLALQLLRSWGCGTCALESFPNAKKAASTWLPQATNLGALAVGLGRIETYRVRLRNDVLEGVPLDPD